MTRIDGKTLCLAALVAALSASAGEDVSSGDGLFVPEPVGAFRAVTGLKWKLPPGARIDGNVLTVVNAPKAGRADPGTVWAEAELDLAECSNRGFEMTIVGSGEDIARPAIPHHGLKFMVQVRDGLSGTCHYPGARNRTGSYTNEQLRLGGSFPMAKFAKGSLFLGLQETTGKVTFDLSTLRYRPTPQPYPLVNGDYVVGYPESVAKRPLLRGVMLPGYKSKEEDFATLKAWGATLVRYQMHETRETSLKVADRDKMTKDEDFRHFDLWFSERLEHLETCILPWARKYGMKVVVDMHNAPGACGHPHKGQYAMLTDDAFARRFVSAWEEIARRFKGNEDVIYGYDLINEPAQAGVVKYDYWTIQKLAANAVRRIDPKTTIIIESNMSDSPEAFAYLSPLKMDNVIYQVHMYQPFGFTHQGLFGAPRGIRYPDAQAKWDVAYLERVLRPVVEFQRRHKAKIFVGEFSVRNGAEGADVWMADVIGVFEKYGWDWTFHAFRESPYWSVEHVEDPTCPNRLIPSADNPRMRVLKAALGRSR